MANNNLGRQELIALLDIYLNEYIHRENTLWSHVFKFFYANLIIILLPNLAEFVGIVLPPIPIYMFNIIGLFMSAALLYASLSMLKRVEASTKTYSELIGKLPDGYQRVKIRDLKNGKFFEIRITYVLVIVIFSALFLLNILIFIYSYAA